jgi:hypothetical protein
VEDARAVAAAVDGYTDSLAGTASGLPGEGEDANKAPYAQAGLMLAVRVVVLKVLLFSHVRNFLYPDPERLYYRPSPFPGTIGSAY